MHIRHFFRIHPFTALEYTLPHSDHNRSKPLFFGATQSEPMCPHSSFALKMTSQFKCKHKQDQTVQLSYKKPFQNST